MSLSSSNHSNQITITGASGFLGFNLTHYFLDQGFLVKALIGPDDDIEEFKKRIPPIYPIQIDQVDIRNLEDIKNKITDSEIIIHTAGIANFGLKEKLYEEINVEGTRNVCQISLQNKVKLLIHISSAETLLRDKKQKYGMESLSINSTQASGPYTQSKLEAELILRDFIKQGLNAIIIHPTTPIGEYDTKPTPPGKLIQMYLQKKLPAYYNAGVNFIGISDLVRGIHLAIEKGKIGENYILGGENIYLEDLFKIMEDISGIKSPTKKIPYQLALSSSYIMEKKDRLLGRIPVGTSEGVKSVKIPFFFDTSKANDHLGFEAKSIENDLRKSINYFQK